MSCLPEGRTARRGPKVTERPSGLDEPPVLAPSGFSSGGTRNRGPFVCRPRHLATGSCTPFYPPRCGHPLWGQRKVDAVTIFRSALVGGLAAAVVLSHRVPSYGGIHGTADRPPPPVFFHKPPSDPERTAPDRAEGRCSQPAGSRASGPASTAAPRRASRRRASPRLAPREYVYLRTLGAEARRSAYSRGGRARFGGLDSQPELSTPALGPGFNHLVRLDGLHAVHRSVISSQPIRRNPTRHGVIRELTGVSGAEKVTSEQFPRSDPPERL
jgi:hypothetical protein